ncbi:aldo-keto reductase family 1 member B1-like isoform X1 [Bactrocera tryoni]|uniref:aldo-keto reductase family 1 member B1-like isoform X1 n=1 Tax=Bactrocera tryoni TaxID=59916 RepID=UPI001A9940B7|nr:aldo-keto reductase family 1 member B1-like isoform X1 [Bactrocera tryoni]
MKKINHNSLKLVSKIPFRQYSGEYRIFHFTGFGNPPQNDNDTEINAKKLLIPKTLEATSGISDRLTYKDNLSENVSKSPPALKNLTNTALLESSSIATTTSKPPVECAEKKLEKKTEKPKCLRPVPRVKLVDEPPDDCNVRKAEIPIVKLRDGHVMPMFGLGTWGAASIKAERAVKHALKVGYRMIDCAHVYENEEAVGKAINRSIEKCIVKREELFVISKLWNTFHEPHLVMTGCRQSLCDLKLSYLNLYLIHWPMGYRAGDDLIPYDACGRVIGSRVDYIETWRAMEELVERRLTRSIGLSNFNKNQIERIWKIAKIKPVVNQVECHPYLNQKRLKAYLKKKGVVLVAYSPLGAPARPWVKKDEPKVLDDNLIKTIAFNTGRTPAQVCIRYQIQRGNPVIPKSVTPSRIESNFDVANFELSDQEMKILDKLDRKLRFVTLSQLSNHPHYPFNDDF